MITNEEDAVKYVTSFSLITEKEIRKLYPEIELYCAQHVASVQMFIDELIRLSDAGIRAAKAGKQLKKAFDLLEVK